MPEQGKSDAEHRLNYYDYREKIIADKLEQMFIFANANPLKRCLTRYI
jgi:hypothetical protein